MSIALVSSFGQFEIEGNEKADRIVDCEAKDPQQPRGLADEPTISV